MNNNCIVLLFFFGKARFCLITVFLKKMSPLLRTVKTHGGFVFSTKNLSSPLLWNKTFNQNYVGVSRMVKAQQLEQKLDEHHHNQQLLNKSKSMAKPTNAIITSQLVFDRENKYGAHNYHPLPVALAKGEGK